MELLAALKANPFVLAPMAGITDRPFRTLMRQLDCGVVITELVSAHGLEFNSEKTRRLMEFEEVQRPIGVQLFGETPEIIGRSARVAQDFGADFIDLNFGCPVPKVTKKGAGSAVLRDLTKVAEIFRAVRAQISIPLTVKIRTGWDESSRNAIEVAAIAYNEGLTWVAIHGRTRAQNYTGLADWDYIAEVKAKSRIPILGNGDILSAETAVQRLRETGCDGVMIGRGCLKNPWIFRDAQELWWREKKLLDPLNHVATPRPMKSEASFLADKDFEKLLREMYQTFLRCTDEKITQLQLKKFASWYSSGYPGASNFRKAIFQTQTLEETLELTLAYFADIRSVLQADTSQEAFLMGGHG